MIIFASDFHLSEADPAGVETFLAFVESRVKGANHFYILGDLFNLWIGPAQLETAALEPVFVALQELVAGGTGVSLFHGNRDFLLGRREAQFLGAALPGESLRAEIDGRAVFLTHGDIFCTRDLAYQRMKKIIRNPLALGLARLLPAFGVRFLARRLRARSVDAVAGKDDEETAITRSAVDFLARTERCDTVICGHVHRAGEFALDGGATLLVLSEWRDGAGTYAESAHGLIALREFF